ncbi:chromate efflux transporter [Zestomonas carbonaria]|uniref:Putative chromate transport protein n=1 Tax=Zestomonas carbonaria TaxID=2762745 RepID=A0A7U7ESW2_9GAMM|nr:chromate efflux transporter [Pseudomonas carbonaria]CAD5110567.1 putative chromate transport protein [Pseudomonas carbonaria]
MQSSDSRHTAGAWEVFLVFLRLGLTSFGGPIAHIGYFRDEFVVRRQWLSERGYADLVALCQFLPGPASSQVGMALGLSRAGYAGALAAWSGFTLPSAIVLILFALGLSTWGAALPAGVLHGLKLVALAVVAQAVWGMARVLCVGLPRLAIMFAAAVAVLLWPGVPGQVATILIAGLVGLVLLRPALPLAHDALPVREGRRGALAWLGLFFVLLLGLPIAAQLWPGQALALTDAFYRAGALVFGGGHVVLPLLQAEVVAPGWIVNDTFLAGYGIAQAVPGPLFTFAAFLGAAVDGVWGGLLCLLAIFLPSFLLVAGILPFWECLRGQRRVQAALAGINAAVVGLLLAALYQPLWTSTVDGVVDFLLALLAWAALVFWKLPPWLLVSICAGGGWLAGGLQALS